MKYRIGYFAHPGFSQMTCVHVVDKDSKPLCGCSISPLKEFYWCANVTPWMDSRGLGGYIECSRCLKKMRQILNEDKNEEEKEK